MSDSRFHAGRPAGPDPLGNRLDALRADIDRLSVTPAGSIRRRGDRRTTLQIAGSTLAAASAIGVVSLVLPFGGADGSAPITTPTQSTPTASTPAQVVPTLTDADLLGPDVLDALLGSVGDVELGWAVGQTHDNPGLALSPVCLPRIASPDASQSLAREFVVARYEGANDPNPGVPTGVVEVAIVQPDPETADETASDLFAWLVRCGQADSGTTVNAAWTLLGAADAGFAVEVLVDAVEGEIGLGHQVAVGRSGSVVVGVLLTKTAMEGGTPDDTLAVLQSAMSKVCQRTGTTCPSETITAERSAFPGEGGGEEESTPPSVGPLLDLDELPTWDGLLPWDTAFDVEDVEAGPYGVVCNPLWRDLGATSELQRQFSVVTGTDPGDEPSATEVVADFPDDAAAAAAMATVRDAMAGCHQSGQVDPGLTVEEVSSPSDAGSVWLVTLPSDGVEAQRVLIGIVANGTRTAMITVTYASTDPLSPQPFLALLPTAAARLPQ